MQAQQRQYVKEQRRERWQEESGQARQYSTAGVGGVFAGEGERETVVRQYEQQMQQYNTAMLQQQQYQSQLQHQYQQQQQYQPQQQQYNQQYQQPQQHQQAYAQARPASSSAYYPAAPAAQARSSGAFAAQAAGPSSPSPAQQPSYLTASGGPTYHVLSVSPGETAAAPSPTRAFNPRKMDEQQRQARYPGIRPKSAVTVRPAAPFDRPGVDRPVAAINPAAVNDRAHAWAAARQPKPAPPQDKYLPAPGQQRPSDVNGIYADMVADQLKKAAVKGAGRRVRAEAPPRGLA